MNILRRHLDTEFVGFLHDIDADVLGSLSVGDSELYFLPDEIVELESCKIGRNVLCSREEQRNQ